MRIAIIPARGGSKRIPKKNTKLFCGKPIMAYSIEAAKQSQVFDHIIVSTDDPDIAAVAEEWGAQLPFMRNPAIADDYTGIVPVIADALGNLDVEFNTGDLFCCIYATAPMLQEAYLRQGCDGLESSSDKDFALAVTEYAFPFQRALLNRKGLVPADPGAISQRSQDLEPGYHDAGQFFWGRCQALLQGKQLYQNNTLAVVLPRYLVQDIDTLEDWQRAELMYQAYYHQQKKA